MKRICFKKEILLVVFVVMFFSIVIFSYAAEEVINWTMYTSASGTIWPNRQWKNVIIPEIERITNGRLKIDILYFGEYPYKNSDLLNVVSEGVADIVDLGPSQVSGTDPRFCIVEMPMLVPSYPGYIQKIHHRINDEVLKDAFDEWNVHEILVTWMGAQHFFLRDFWIEDVNSLRGKKIRVFSPEQSDLVQNILNGTPVRIDSSEVYTALQTGVIDGLITGISSGYDNKLFEMVPNLVPTFIQDGTFAVYVNNDSWNSLPEDIREIVQNYFDKIRADYEMNVTYQNGVDLINSFHEYGMEAIPIPKELREEMLANSYEMIWKPWMERVGEDGEKIFKEVVNIIESEGFKVPLPTE